MAGKLHFSLVSPERELFCGEVDGVDVPGEEGDFGVLPNHAPVMTTIRPGAITIADNGTVRRMFIRGGFADVTPEGLIILAEEAIDLEAVDAAKVAQDLRDAEEGVREATTDVARADAQTRLEYAQSLAAALNS